MIKTYREFNESLSVADDLDVLTDVADALKDKGNTRIDKEDGETTINIFIGGKDEDHNSCKTYFLMQPNFYPNFFVADTNIPDTSKMKVSKFRMIKSDKDSQKQYTLLTSEIRDRLELEPPYYVAVWYSNEVELNNPEI